MDERMSWQARWGSILLLAVGLARMVGTLTGSRELSAYAAATAASPAPQRFASHRGPEVLSMRATLSWIDHLGRQIVMDFNPMRLALVQGPASRRNMYLTLIVHGPSKITSQKMRPMFDSLIKYALCGERMLLAEMGADPWEVIDPVVLQLRPRTMVREGLPLDLMVECE
jgi:hypothetical protein